jgi:hypothetical protein
MGESIFTKEDLLQVLATNSFGQPMTKYKLLTTLAREIKKIIRTN